MELAEVKELKDNSKRADWAIKIFWGILGLNILIVAASFYELNLLKSIQEGYYLEDWVYDYNDLLQGVLGLIHMTMTIATIVIFLNWFRRAFGNLHRLGASDLEYSETMAVWSFFIPILNLFRPYSIAKKIAEKTRAYLYTDNPSIKDYSNNTIVFVWWIAYLIMSFVGNYVFRVSWNAETVEELMLSSQAYLISGIVDMIAAFFTIQMIKTISTDEQALFEKWKSTKSNLNLMDTFVDNIK